jgi:hypothetical protein
MTPRSRAYEALVEAVIEAVTRLENHSLKTDRRAAQALHDALITYDEILNPNPRKEAA